VRLTQDDIWRWARLSGDFNPVHVDEAFAATTRYGGTIVHGHLVLTWLVDRANAVAPGWRAIEGLRFRRPVRPGVEYEVRDADGVLTVVDQDGEVCVEATLIR
jgi:acyl dehydratase